MSPSPHPLPQGAREEQQGGLGDPQLRASSDYRFIVGALRARGLTRPPDLAIRTNKKPADLSISGLTDCHQDNYALTLAGRLMTGIWTLAFPTFPVAVYRSISRRIEGLRNVSPHWLQTSARTFLNRYKCSPHRCACSMVLRLSGALQNAHVFMVEPLSSFANQPIALDLVGRS